jgi:hypothetical protein
VQPSSEDSVVLNCPFDAEYQPMFRAMVFTVHDAGFIARCALELSDATQNRLTKILGIISECRYGIHDISRTELNEAGLPRFNMPFELGLFLACKAFGGEAQGGKSCLVLDREPYRYQRFISDIAGQDVYAHDGDPQKAVRRIREWLRTASKRSAIPGPTEIWNRFARFQSDLPAICIELRIRPDELTFVDYTYVVAWWLRQNAL